MKKKEATTEEERYFGPSSDYTVVLENEGFIVRIVKKYKKPVQFEDIKPVRFLKKRHATMMVLVAAVISLSWVPLFGAFEAHVINVTAKIEPVISMCDVKSPGYWKNHDGCSKGKGNSIWTNDINSLSLQFSSVFASYSGAEICMRVDAKNCPSGNSLEARRCRAELHTLANELNVVSDHLALDAFIAGAYDEHEAFNYFDITELSTVEETLSLLESVIASASSTKKELGFAAYIAERIYEFYENENPFSPDCIYDPNDIPQCRGGFKGNIHIQNENEADVETTAEENANTGGNEGGEIDTGNASSTVSITNEININEITISGCCTGTTTSTSSPCCVREEGDREDRGTSTLQELKDEILNLLGNNDEEEVSTEETASTSENVAEETVVETTTEEAPEETLPQEEIPAETETVSTTPDTVG
jgi:hypothetical protein